MKTMKKLLALTLALALVLSLAITASATTITIDKGTAGAEYAAYKLLNATDGGNDKFAYTLNEKYAEALKTVTGEETEADIIAYISAMTGKGDEIRAFADAVYAEVKSMTPDYTTKTDEFKDVAQGYYLIAETKVGNEQDTYSLVMLDTAGKDDVTVDTKEDLPSLEKKVQEKNDSTGNVSDWQDGADYDINDEVPFKLTGTVSDKYENYHDYYYAFHDTLSDGLTLIYREGQEDEDIVVKVDGVEVPNTNYSVTVNGQSFTVEFMDLKKVSETKPGSITVEFKATLNEGAVIGTPGNPNVAKLEYSNNPYFEGDGTTKPDDTGETPEDKVVVFTYKLVVNKFDGMNTPDAEDDVALNGAGFILYKYDASATTADKWVAVGDMITGSTTFTFTGLDAGQYKLVEEKVPAGYNKADDVYFNIVATYDIEADEPELKTLSVTDKDGNTISEGEEATFSTVVTDGSVNTKVINNSGVELPSTGGIGTTIFYVVGGLLTLAAVVLLVTKKKMSAAE